MPFRLRFLVLLALQLSLFPVARAEGPQDSDWLIERWNGKWELVARGPAGRVEKRAPNQEILRMGQDNTVLVMTMPPLDGAGTVLCFSSKRHDYRSSCSSAFLDCSKINEGAYSTLVNGLLGFDMAEVRNRLECRINTNAVLQAAKAVGMISTILPVGEKAPAN